MEAKKKLFVWCDFLVDTGFGHVAHNLLDRMHEHFDVSILGINYYGDKRYDTSKYFVYPITREDPLGVRKLPHLLKNEKPDVVLLFQDIFHISDYIDEIKKALHPKTKIVTYFPVDGSPFSQAWGNVFDIADVNITYSDWAIRTIRETFPKITKLHKLYHGVDTNIYKALPYEKVLSIRKEFGWTGKFVVLNVNRFQPRKLIPHTLRAFSLFSKGYKKCSCGNVYPYHKEYCDLNMCGPESVIEKEKRYRVDTHLHLHMMSNEPMMGPGRVNSLQNHALNAGFTDEDVRNRLLGINALNIYANQVPDEVINGLYNAANINISSTLGEGCGLSLIESMSAGTPSIAPKNSAIPEMLGNTGHLIPNVGLMNQALDSGHLRPVVDTYKMMQALDIEYNKWKSSGEEKIVDSQCIERVTNNFLWKDKVDFLTNILSGV